MPTKTAAETSAPFTRWRLRLRNALADQSLGQHDREHHDRHHAARVEEELDREQEGLVEQQEDHTRRDERRREVQHGVEQVR